MKLYMETFGCQMNELDSQLVLGQFRALGYQSIDNRDDADVILFNTCSVREHAEQKVWSRLGQLRDRKKTRPGQIIAVIGCMAERDGAALFQRYPHVDVLCGPGELDKLTALVHNAIIANANYHGGKRTRQVALIGSTARRSGTHDAAEDKLELLDLSRSIGPADDLSQAYVRITRGCNKFCTYCVVPFTRGPEVHRPPQNIIDEVKRLADAGVREVTLLGQTINHYAFQNPDGHATTFAQLLYQVHEATPHLPRLRFVTSFPRDYSDDALAVMRDCPRICHYLHIPAQSGSDRILKLMNRGYTSAQYYDLIDRARDYMPDISLASDFIVGFPTETDEDYDLTAAMVRRCRFKNSFIFKYSPRPGTAASKHLPDDVPDPDKRRRNNDLLAIQHQVSLAENRGMIGKTVQVIVEGQSKLLARPPAAPAQVELLWEEHTCGNPAIAVDKVQLVGRTRGDQVVVFDGPPGLRGQLLDVRIVDAQSMTLFANLL